MISLLELKACQYSNLTQPDLPQDDFGLALKYFQNILKKH